MLDEQQGVTRITFPLTYEPFVFSFPDIQFRVCDRPVRIECFFYRHSLYSASPSPCNVCENELPDTMSVVRDGTQPHVLGQGPQSVHIIKVACYKIMATLLECLSSSYV